MSRVELPVKPLGTWPGPPDTLAPSSPPSANSACRGMTGTNRAANAAFIAAARTLVPRLVARARQLEADAARRGAA